MVFGNQPKIKQDSSMATQSASANSANLYLGSADVILSSTKSVLGEYITAWASELYAVKWWRHPTCVSLTIAM